MRVETGRGRGPQLSTTRITVLDIVYYLRRGHDFDCIQQVMPSLSRAEFDVVLDYVNLHRDDLIEADRRADEFICKGVEAQRARGGMGRVSRCVFDFAFRLQC